MDLSAGNHFHSFLVCVPFPLYSYTTSDLSYVVDTFAPCFFPFTTYPEVPLCLSCLYPPCLVHCVIPIMQPHQGHSFAVGIHIALVAPLAASRTMALCLWRDSSGISQKGDYWVQNHCKCNSVNNADSPPQGPLPMQCQEYQSPPLTFWHALESVGCMKTS